MLRKMTIGEALSQYYENSPFDENETLTQDWVKFFAGKHFITVPNFPMRKRLIRYHDLAHMLTGYKNSRIGEGEVSAWELGAGFMHFHPSVFFGLFGLSTGLIFSPKRMKEAFLEGRKSNYLMQYDLNYILNQNESEFRELILFLDYPLLVLCFSLSALLYPVLLLISTVQSYLKK